MCDLLLADSPAETRVRQHAGPSIDREEESLRRGVPPPSDVAVPCT
jgi:hypothetical protein